jgi:DNA-binding NarL/FixJ family response regulator
MEVAGEAENAEQAINMIRQSEFDVALVDIGLPGKGGLELLKQIRSERPRLAVLMLSMYAEEVYAVRALKAGAVGLPDQEQPAGDAPRGDTQGRRRRQACEPGAAGATGG